MAKQLMIYERAVPISIEAHKDWSVKSDNTYGFARDVNSVPVLAAEFAPAAMEYTIIFAGDGDVVFPSVILGMKEGQNAHVKSDNTWDGRYVPAFFRRYPFVFAASDDQSTFTLCIDEEYEGLNKKGQGERLFDADGNRTQYLENVLAFSTEYQGQFTRTQAFAKRLLDLDLLEPAQAQFNLAGGERTQLSGFKTINRDKLRNLPAETLAEMAKTDELELCYLHLQSLNNLTPMTQRLAARSESDAA
ncbi:SapC family protein [Yoonia sediminilitoris]|uniref:SapC protein n=1 Tax=Yoonia sediminilitoris TaxID=1286148 RepID=A0A2T6KLJ9_9RHOB|nr:SapC family protein [Yoonia sediminilitoris]PUB17071.1 SapC protein [Yoonia sediminilitoris]RCW97366.1 SapC protein [Yoonia sediminilitoris]